MAQCSPRSNKRFVDITVPGSCSPHSIWEIAGMYSRLLWMVAFLLGCYFLWMDIALYHHVQQWTAGRKTKEGFGPFNPLSVKLIMIDHMSHYIQHIGSEYFEIVTRFSENFPHITPNMISFTHLICAFIGARLVACEKLHWRQVGVALYELRDFLDSLDGVVFRARSKQRKTFVSGWGTSGYFVDILSDIAAGVALFIGIWIFLSRYPPLQSQQNCIRLSEEGTTNLSNGRVPKRTVVIVLLAFGFRFLFTGGVWDHFVHMYHDVLEISPVSQQHQVIQEEFFHSSFTWVIWWFWRIGNALAAMQFVLIAIFIDKLWELLTFTHYIGWAFFLSLSLVSQFHTMYVSIVQERDFRLSHTSQMSSWWPGSCAHHCGATIFYQETFIYGLVRHRDQAIFLAAKVLDGKLTPFIGLWMGY